MSLSIRLFGNRDRAQELIDRAKKQMALLKQFMGFQNLKQLEPQPIRMFDGSTIRVRSIFGIDIIDITGAVSGAARVIEEITGGQVIFLITSKSAYAMWKIEENGEVLTPQFYAFDTTKFKLHPEVEPPLRPSTVQSNENLNEHHILVEDMSGEASWEDSDCVASYGWYCLHHRYGWINTSPVNLLVGMENSYLPIGWGDNDRQFFDETSFGVSDANMICSSRHNWMPNPVIKNLRMMLNGLNKGVITWESKEGTQEDGTQHTMQFIDNRPMNMHAVLNKTKFIGKDMDDTTASYYDKTYQEMRYSNCGLDPEPIPITVLTWSHYSAYGGSPVKFGAVVIDNTENGNSHEQWMTNINQGPHPCYYAGWDDCRSKYLSQHRNWYLQYSWYDPKSTINLIDYDNLDNDDKTFFVFWNTDGGRVQHQEYFRSCGGGGAVNNSGWVIDGMKTGSKGRVQYLGYRINEGDFIRIPIARLSTDCDYSEWGAPYTSRYTNEFTGICSNYIGEEATLNLIRSNVQSGNRAVNPTCKIVDAYILYSYVLENFVGSGSPGLDDQTPENWEVDKRIMGIIHMATSTRTEHEVNDAFLGDLYKNKFNKELASAIGLHIIDNKEA